MLLKLKSEHGFSAIEAHKFDAGDNFFGVELDKVFSATLNGNPGLLLVGEAWVTQGLAEPFLVWIDHTGTAYQLEGQDKEALLVQVMEG